MGATSRSTSTDPFNQQRFHITDTAGLLNLATPAAGFNQCVIPELSVGVVEYQEGINRYRKKFPGEPSFAPITLGKGVVKSDTAFYKWIMATIEDRPYRTNLIIKHYHRDDVSGLVDYKNAVPYREIILNHAFATRVKLGSDLDGVSQEISIEEIDIEYEFLDYKIAGQAQTAAILSNPA